jgi:hypothetical protein
VRFVHAERVAFDFHVFPPSCVASTTSEPSPVVAVAMHVAASVHAIEFTVAPSDHGSDIGGLHDVPASEEKAILDVSLTPPETTAAHDEVPKQLSVRIP